MTLRSAPKLNRFEGRQMHKLVTVLALAALVSVVACSAPGSGLTGKAWQWTAATTTVPASQSVVPDPENYTIEFKADGTFVAKADCNQVSGTYTTAGNNALAIVPGPSTLAMCPEGSMDSLFIAGLSATRTYAIASSQLVLTRVDDGTMTFQ